MFNTKKLLTTIAATSVAALALTSCSIGGSNSADGGENIVVSVSYTHLTLPTTPYV